MTSLEMAINLRYLFLTFKPKKKTINTCTTFFCIYWYVSIYLEKCFWPQYMYLTLRPNNGYRWCPLGKLSHLGLEQLTNREKMLITLMNCTKTIFDENLEILDINHFSVWFIRHNIITRMEYISNLLTRNKGAINLLSKKEI